MAERFIQSGLAGLQFIEEVTRGTDPGAGYTRLRHAFEIVPKPKRALHEIPAQKSEDHSGADPHVMGAEGGTLEFKAPLYTLSGTESPIVSLLGRMGGTINECVQKSGGVIGGAADEIHVDDVDNAGLAVGSLVYHNSAAGTDSIRMIERVQTGMGAGSETHCTVSQDFASAPVASDTIEAFDSVTPKGGEPDKYFTFKAYMGEGATDRLLVTMSGCAGTWSLETAGPSSLPAIAFSFNVDNWTTTESSLAQTDATGNEPRPILGANLLLDGSALRSKSFGFSPGQALMEVEDLSATHGRQAHFYSEPSPSIEIEPLHDVDWWTKLQAGATHEIELEDIDSTTDAWAFVAPAVQVMDYETTADDQLLRGSPTLELRTPGHNADDDQLPLYVFGMTP